MRGGGCLDNDFRQQRIFVHRGPSRWGPIACRVGIRTSIYPPVIFHGGGCGGDGGGGGGGVCVCVGGGGPEPMYPF